MQMVAIVKAIAFNAEVIIMDEPTSAITEREVEQLFRVIGELKKQQKAIVYISHKMDEIYKIADMITIMRDGSHIATKKISEIAEEEVIPVSYTHLDVYKRQAVNIKDNIPGINRNL